MLGLAPAIKLLAAVSNFFGAGAQSGSVSKDSDFLSLDSVASVIPRFRTALGEEFCMRIRAVLMVRLEIQGPHFTKSDSNSKKWLSFKTLANSDQTLKCRFPATEGFTD